MAEWQKEKKGLMTYFSLPSLLVVASLALLVHATLCAIQRKAVPRGPRITQPVARAVLTSRLLMWSHVRRQPCFPADRDYLKAVQQPFVYSPFAVSLQCITAVGLGTWGVLGAQGSFLPIRTTEVMGKQTIDSLEPVCSR